MAQVVQVPTRGQMARVLPLCAAGVLLPITAALTVPAHKHGWASLTPGQWAMIAVATGSAVALPLAMRAAQRRAANPRATGLAVAHVPLLMGVALAMSGSPGGVLALFAAALTFFALLGLTSVLSARAAV